ncbi:MAG TPA: YfhO family protein [Thermoanaerobaculia bacterium]|nr:YfhO family protein [Thermoanaerobaculia bacterium]
MGRRGACCKVFGIPTLASFLDVLLFLLGGLLLGALARWWRPEVSWRAGGGYLLLAFAFYAVPLTGPASQAATDIAYLHLPWKETLEEPVRPGNPTLSDVPLQMLPFRALVRARLLAGEAPLWAHELGTGQPLLGNAQSAPFAPLHLLALPRPALAALTVTAAWQMLVGLLLTHALLLRLGAGGVGAAFGAVAFALSSYAVAWAYHPLGAVAAWVPGVLLGVVLRRGERGGFAGLVACATAATLAGHPESLANAALASAAVTVALLVAKEAGKLRFLARLAAAAVLTFALSAPALLPFVETLAESERWEAVHRNPNIVKPGPPSPATLLPVLQPLVHGSPRERTWQGPGRSNFNELCTVWAGLAALAVAIAGAVTLRGPVLAILLAGGAALAAALRVPPFFQVMETLPLLGHGAHGRLRLLWVLAVAIAAGLSLEALTRRRTGAIAGALAFTLLGVAVAALPPPGDSPWTRAWWLVALAGAAACLAALLVPRFRPAFPKVTLGALAVELFLLGVRFHPVLDPRFDLSPPPVVAWLADRAREGPPHRVLADGRDLMPNLASLEGIWDARAHDPMSPAAPSSVIGTRLRPHHKVGRLVLHGPRRDPALENYLGVRYLLTRHRARVPPPWRSVFNHQGGRVWENPEALPLFFMPENVERVGSQQKALARARVTPDFAATAVVEGATARAAAQRGTVQIARVRPNGFELTVEGLGGTVVSSVSQARGWRATLDARPLPLLRANGAFLAFSTPPGRHRVVLDYRPTGWPVGWTLFFAGSLAAITLALRSRSREKRPANGLRHFERLASSAPLISSSR